MKNTLPSGLLIVILALFIFGFLLPTSPLQATEMGIVAGEGAYRCKKFSKASGSKENRFIVWVQGYFSAYNSIAPDVSDINAGNTYFWVLKELKTYCKAHPDAFFNDAVVELIKKLHPKGITIHDPSKIKLNISEN